MNGLLLRTTTTLFVLLLTTAGCAAKQPPSASASVPKPTLEPVAENVWMHKSWARIDPWGVVLSHGLVVKGPEGVTLIDTAWNEEDTAVLLTLVEEKVGAPVDTVIVTHAHADKMGGMNTVHEAGARTLAHALTNEAAPARGLYPASETVGEDQAVGTVEVFYAGPGHTRDNIVVYHPDSKILFGGCLIRPAGTDNLGNTGDADVERWADTVAKVAARFPEAKVVIPSHGPAGGRELLDHTIELARSANP